MKLSEDGKQLTMTLTGESADDKIVYLFENNGEPLPNFCQIDMNYTPEQAAAMSNSDNKSLCLIADNVYYGNA